MDSENIKKLAAEISQIVQENFKKSDNDFINQSVEKINQRLDKIETKLEIEKSELFTNQISLPHPSQNRFTEIEEITDEIITKMQMEKACPYEPTGKPCDKCAMCNSLGF